MDYSLLVKKLDISPEELNKFKLTDEYRLYARHLYEGQFNTAYLIFIIDYLQIFNKNKYLEYLAKQFWNNPSCLPSDKYSLRFIEYVNQITNY